MLTNFCKKWVRSEIRGLPVLVRQKLGPGAQFWPKPRILRNFRKFGQILRKSPLIIPRDYSWNPRAKFRENPTFEIGEVRPGKLKTGGGGVLISL